MKTTDLKMLINGHDIHWETESPRHVMCDDCGWVWLSVESVKKGAQCPV
jgi:predicted Zn-ribbon and HTH transcriptional regulator